MICRWQPTSNILRRLCEECRKQTKEYSDDQTADTDREKGNES